MNVEALRQVMNAQLAAYAALVKTLESSSALDTDSLLARLNGYAELLRADAPVSAQTLTAYAAALSGEAPDTAAIAEMLH